MRPKILHVGGTLYWVIRTRNPDTQVLKDADSTPTVAVRKNGASVGDSVTVTKRSATTGIYDCSYNPASEVEGDEFTIEESATVTGTTTGSATYTASWEFTVIAVERGTDGANTVAPATPSNVTDARNTITALLPAALVGGRIDAHVGAMAANSLTAAAIAADAGAELAALVETYIVNEGDATAVMQAVADKIAADWVAGDASPLAIVAAIKADSTLSTMIGRIDATVSSRLASESYTAPDNAGIAAIKTVTDKIDTGLVMDGAVYQFTANMLELAPSLGGGGGSGGGGSPVERSPDDDNPIQFTWPVSTGTITVTRSIDGQTPYVAAAGAASFVQTVNGVHWWSLAYNAADRPASEGTALYRLVGSGGDTGLIGLRVAGGLTTRQEETLDKIATVIYGTVTGAGTSTEVFVSAQHTITVTVDESGNRSNVVIT